MGLFRWENDSEVAMMPLSAYQERRASYLRVRRREAPRVFSSTSVESLSEQASRLLAMAEDRKDPKRVAQLNAAAGFLFSEARVPRRDPVSRFAGSTTVGETCRFPDCLDQYAVEPLTTSDAKKMQSACRADIAKRAASTDPYGVSVEQISAFHALQDAPGEERNSAKEVWLEHCQATDVLGLNDNN